MATTKTEIEVELTKPSGALAHKLAVDSIEKNAFAQTVDLYCELKEKIEPLAAKVAILEKELKPVEAQIQATLDIENAPDEEGIRQTENYLLSFSYKGKATELTDKQKLIEILGINTFIELAQVKIEDLQKYLTEKQMAQLTKVNHKNKRRLKFAPIQSK